MKNVVECLSDDKEIDTVLSNNKVVSLLSHKLNLLLYNQNCF